MQIEQLFHLVGNPNYRQILLRDFEELNICYKNKAYKATIVLVGSILEAILIEFFVSKANSNGEIRRIQNLKLFQLIDKAKEENLISERTKNLSNVLRDYRNYIHPAKEIRTKDYISEETAAISFNLLKLVLKEVHNNYDNLYGYRAEDVYLKLKSDESTIAIFDSLISKMNLEERVKLIEIIFNESNVDSIYNSNNSQYLSSLIRHLNEDFIKEYVEKLYKEVESGKSQKVEIYFNFFGDKLSVISNVNRDIILKYIYQHIGSNDLLNYDNTNIFNYLSKYTDESNKNLLLNLVGCIANEIIQSKDSEYSSLFIDKYFEMIKSLIQDLKWEEVANYFNNHFNHNEYDFFMVEWKSYSKNPNYKYVPPSDDLPF